MQIQSFSDKELKERTQGALLTKGLECLLEGIHIMVMEPSNKLLASSFTSGTISESEFLRAKKEFTQADIHFSALLASSKYEYQYDGKALVRFLKQLLVKQDDPFKLTMITYEDEDSTQKDLDLAYELYQSYVLAIGHLKDILDKIKSGEIKAKWLPNTEIPLDKLPNLNLPKSLNRKHKDK